VSAPNGTDSREALARVRDESGAQRDREAALRDRLADAADVQIEDFERAGSNGNGNGRHLTGEAIVVRAARDRERAAADRASAAAQRAAAARDREQASRDRELAAADRAHAAAELAMAGVDDLTGALRRGVGLTSLQREVDRAHRTGEPLVIAFVDVDGLKRVNDTRGHVGGDRLLRRTAELIKTHLRPYDVIVRVGGDEFVCSIYGVARGAVGERLALVSADLASGPAGGAISVGLAELEPRDSLDDVIGRADAALLAKRGANRPDVRRFRRRPR
jgi:diguanylate cyclase (GGDEF)-like protein